MRIGNQSKVGTLRPFAVARLCTAMALAALIAVLFPGAQANAAFPGTNGKILFNRGTFAFPFSTNPEVFATDGNGSAPVSVVPVTHPAGCSTCGVADARYSPDRTRVAYTMSTPVGTKGATDIEIFVAGVDSSGIVTGSPTQLTHVAGSNGNHAPSWSPDGTKIAFSSDRDTPQGDEIYLMDAQLGDTNGVTRLTTNGTPTFTPADIHPVFSPDGTTIAFSSNRVGNSYQIYVMDANPAHITGGNAANQRKLEAAVSGGGDTSPNWSPDGRTLTFTSSRTGDLEVFRASLSGTSSADFTATTVTNLTNSPSSKEYGPQFSPDGTKIAFSRVTDVHQPPAIYVMNNDGSSPTLVISNGEPTDWAAAPATPTHHAPADFDGNGTTDVSVFRPSNGTWYVNGGATTTWGTSSDIPVPGNYTGTATTNVAVYRPGSAGTWYINGGPIVTWGTTGDIPVPGDYNGDGTTDIAVFRPSTGTWFVNGGAVTNFGTSGDIPVPGDYNGDGTTDIAVFRPSTGTWYVNSGGITNWGTSGDVPVPGDYNGDGTTDIAVFRPSTGTWYVNGGAIVNWGTSGDIPEPGNYSGTATTDIAVYRPGTNTWFVRNGATTTWGASDDIPLPLPAAIRMATAP